ncbi:MAG TPA: hypothetical protein VL171_10705 [Verrucomicrobiae bacterium]|nr:hypothetical protein [Verrucomicrobiae bacterium]
MTKCLNLVGPQIRKLRFVRGWSQNILAAKLQVLGWDIDRGGVAKIEARLVHVDDYELVYFAKVFGTELADLFPKIDPTRRIHDVLTELMRRNPTRRWPSKIAAPCSQMGTVIAKTPAIVAGNVSKQWHNEDSAGILNASTAGFRAARVLG